MKSRILNYYCLLVALVLSLGFGSARQASGQSCAIGFPPPAGNVLTSFISIYPNYPNSDAYFHSQVAANSPLPAGTYLTWCVDANTDIDPSQGFTVPGTYYTGALYPDCDTNLNLELPAGHPATCYVTPDVWQKVNYLLNHKNGAYFWEVQVAISGFVGGPAQGPSPPYPPFNSSVVNNLISDANANAPTWTPKCGDVVGAVYVITNQAGVYLANPVQFLMLEVPVCPINFTLTPANTNMGCNPVLSSIPDCVYPINTNIVNAVSCCGRPVTITCASSSASAGCHYTRYLNYTATDGYGNTATYIQSINWTIDTNAPIFVNIPAGGDLGSAPTNLPTDASIKALVTVADSCSSTPTVTVTHVDSGTTCSPIRTFTITALDTCNNSATQTVVYTWKTDTTAPIITVVPTGSNLGCNPATNTLPTDASVKAGVVATDNSGSNSIIVTHVDSGSVCGYTRVFTIMAVDYCSNTSAVKTVTYTWSADTNAPVITSSPAASTALGCNPTNIPSDAMIASLITATDNCSVASTNVNHVDSGTACAMSRVFTITVADACGNVSAPKSATYTWTVDTNAPVITSAPTNSALGCNPTNIPSDAMIAALVSVTDNCTVTSTNVSHVDSGTACAMSRVFSISAVDTCGNTSAVKTVTYTWSADTNAPVITASPAVSTALGCNPASLPTDASIAALIKATDNCTIASTNVSHVDSGTACAMSRVFTITVADACGNLSAAKTATYTWTVDTNAPVITAVPAGAALGCNPASLPTVASVAASVKATDNCTLASTNISFVDSGTACAMTRVFTITVSDACGNVSAAKYVTYTWTIDTAAPVVSNVPTNTFLGCGPSVLPSDASIAALISVSDNCTVASTNVSHVDATNGCMVSRTFTITASDACGNTSAPKTVVYSWSGNKVGPTIICPSDIILSNSVVPYCTWTMDDYDAPCNGTNAGSILTNCWKKVYTNGYVQCGNIKTNGYCVKFTSTTNVCKYFPASGNPGCLKYNYSNPTNCEAGAFGGQVLCLKLNVDLSDCKTVTNMPCGYGDLVLNDASCSLHGKSVREILDICHEAIGGGDISRYGCTISNLHTICSNINQSFRGCVPSDWCKGHIVPPVITNVPPSTSGYPVVSSGCGDTNNAVTYKDVITAGACAGTYSITRTWTAVDSCGNTNTCTQNISIGNTKASVCGYVFQDCNGDGHLSPGLDVGMTNILVTLKNSSGVIIGTNVTDSTGNYCFFNLTPGTYTVSIVQPGSTVQTAGCHTNHWLDNSGNDCWHENDGYQHWKGGDGVDCWNANDGYKHYKNSNGYDCWTDRYGYSHTQNCSYVSCNVPKNNVETFTVSACEAKNGVNFSYLGNGGKAVVCVTGPSYGYCGQTLNYTCTVTNTGNACFNSCQVTACGRTYTCPNLRPGEGCSIPISYTCNYWDCGTFTCKPVATCGYKASSTPCTVQASCNTQVYWW